MDLSEIEDLPLVALRRWLLYPQQKFNHPHEHMVWEHKLGRFLVRFDSDHKCGLHPSRWVQKGCRLLGRFCFHGPPSTERWMQERECGPPEKELEARLPLEAEEDSYSLLWNWKQIRITLSVWMKKCMVESFLKYKSQLWAKVVSGGEVRFWYDGFNGRFWMQLEEQDSYYLWAGERIGSNHKGMRKRLWTSSRR